MNIKEFLRKEYNDCISAIESFLPTYMKLAAYVAGCNVTLRKCAEYCDDVDVDFQGWNLACNTLRPACALNTAIDVRVVRRFVDEGRLKDAFEYVIRMNIYDEWSDLNVRVALLDCCWVSWNIANKLLFVPDYMIGSAKKYTRGTEYLAQQLVQCAYGADYLKALFYQFGNKTINTAYRDRAFGYPLTREDLLLAIVTSVRLRGKTLNGKRSIFRAWGALRYDDRTESLTMLFPFGNYHIANARDLTVIANKLPLDLLFNVYLSVAPLWHTVTPVYEEGTLVASDTFSIDVDKTNSCRVGRGLFLLKFGDRLLVSEQDWYDAGLSKEFIISNIHRAFGYNTFESVMNNYSEDKPMSIDEILNDILRDDCS
ncbi:MAG: hypothetical protein NC548_11140 [Lachnospiraceae bacterium]|nr:hypothetical protein [Lachnospiraceae bacterium]